MTNDVVSKPNRLRSFRVPLLIAAMAVVLVVTRLLNMLVGDIPILALLMGIGTAVGAVAVYVWLSRRVEARAEIAELPRAGRWPTLIRGFGLGFAAFTVAITLIGVFGGWSVGWDSFGAFVGGFGAMASVAVNEELLFRGVVFRILSERLNIVLAFVLSCFIFGFAHAVNGNASLLGLISIAIQGGSLMASAYLASRSLWLPIGIHMAWDVAEGNFFGVQNSGTEQTGLLHTVLQGPDWLTGGSFGPEASPVTWVVCMAVSAALLLRARRNLSRVADR
jgi:membrane protease YdiL (CAAX protease family)